MLVTDNRIRSVRPRIHSGRQHAQCEQRNHAGNLAESSIRFVINHIFDQTAGNGQYVFDEVCGVAGQSAAQCAQRQQAICGSNRRIVVVGAVNTLAVLTYTSANKTVRIIQTLIELPKPVPVRIRAYSPDGHSRRNHISVLDKTAFGASHQICRSSCPSAVVELCALQIFYTALQSVFVFRGQRKTTLIGHLIRSQKPEYDLCCVQRICVSRSSLAPPSSVGESGLDKKIRKYFDKFSFFHCTAPAEKRMRGNAIQVP